VSSKHRHGRWKSVVSSKHCHSLFFVWVMEEHSVFQASSWAMEERSVFQALSFSILCLGGRMFWTYQMPLIPTWLCLDDDWNIERFRKMC
jgi:hypothetical protein